MPWYIFAVGAAIIWGLHFNLLSKAMTVISPITAYWLPTVIMVIGLPFFYKTVYSDLVAVYHSGWDIKLPVIIISFTSFAASMCIYQAIQMHNPMHAGLIEITYPIFLTIFALILYQQNYFNLSTLIGGGLIMAGSALIIYSHG